MATHSNITISYENQRTLLGSYVINKMKEWMWNWECRLLDYFFLNEMLSMATKATAIKDPVATRWLRLWPFEGIYPWNYLAVHSHQSFVWSLCVIIIIIRAKASYSRVTRMKQRTVYRFHCANHRLVRGGRKLVTCKSRRVCRTPTKISTDLASEEQSDRSPTPMRSILDAMILVRRV